MPLSTFFHTYPDAFVVLMALVGLITGSFLNVVIYRLPLMMEREWRSQCRSLLGITDNSEIIDNSEVKTAEPFNLVIPRSRCPHCASMISAFDNIPIISYLLLRGKCRHCHHPISLRYPAIELTSGILTALVAWHFGFQIQALLAVLLTWALICLTMVDFDHQLLPDDITLPFLWLGLIANMFNLFTDIYSSLSGAIGGYGVLWTVFIAFKLVTGKEGMGHGDFKLLAMLGAWLGWQSLLLIVLLSSVLGAIVGISLIIFARHGRHIPIPFGPYLAFAGWIAMLRGPEIMHIYLNLL